MSERGAEAYSLRPFGLEQWPQALSILRAGFPSVPAAWWEAGHQRLRQVPPSATNLDLGTFLYRAGQAVGVLMLLPSQRPAEPGQPWHMSACNLAIAPAHRERALWLTRLSTTDRTRIYTTVTPITAVVRIAQRLDLTAVAHQCLVGFTPRLALGAVTQGAAWGAEALTELRDHPLAPALEDHHRLGCLLTALRTPQGPVPLVWRARKRLRHLRAAELLYAPSQALVDQHVRTLAAGLLRRGFPVLEFEAHEDLVPSFPCTRLFQRRFARGPYPVRGIDHLYSELVYFHR